MMIALGLDRRSSRRPGFCREELSRRAGLLPTEAEELGRGAEVGEGQRAVVREREPRVVGDRARPCD